MARDLATAKAIKPDATRAGDIKLEWDPDDEERTEAARLAFARALAKGYRAYPMGKPVSAAEEIKEFKPGLGEVIMIAQHVGG
ncbi:MAG: hypothetical protein ACRDL8_21410 [Solirubrobacteraceae bacterium]